MSYGNTRKNTRFSENLIFGVDNHYLDDLVISFQSEEQAIKISQQVVYIHKQASFVLRNFISNSSNLPKAMTTYHIWTACLTWKVRVPVKRYLECIGTPKPMSSNSKQSFTEHPIDVIKGVSS